MLAVTSAQTAIIRNDAVPGMLQSQTRRYRISPPIALTPGVGVDGYVDTTSRPWRWYGAAIAARFVAGLPDKGKVSSIDVGSHLPNVELVDQNGRMVNLGTSYAGKVTLLSFIFTRCRDECPLISAKFAAMQRELDPARFHLIEITIDPAYDSPKILRAYGERFGAPPAVWSLLTGQPHEIGHLLNVFGITALAAGDANFIHSDRLFLSASDGRVAQIVETSGFTPGSMVAQAHHLAGMAASPFGRFQLWLIASVTALCGGNQFAGIVALETVLFLIIAAISFVVLGWVVRRLWA